MNSNGIRKMGTGLSNMQLEGDLDLHNNVEEVMGDELNNLEEAIYDY